MNWKSSFGPTDSDHEDLVEINVIPLVDILLVLLVVFMVAAPLSLSGIALKLPKTETKPLVKKAGRMVLSVDATGQFFFEKKKVPGKELFSRLQAIYTVRADKGLYIRADENVKFRSVAEAMSVAKKAGVEKISMVTQSKASR